MALSSDGTTAILGGFDDNQGAGAAWVFGTGPAVPATPAITSIVNGANFAPGGAILPGSWVAIFGDGLAPAEDSRTWNVATEIAKGKLPVSLDGTSVTVNGRLSAVAFIQPSQVNIQTPDGHRRRTCAGSRQHGDRQHEFISLSTMQPSRRACFRPRRPISWRSTPTTAM